MCTKDARKDSEEESRHFSRPIQTGDRWVGLCPVFTLTVTMKGDLAGSTFLMITNMKHSQQGIDHHGVLPPLPEYVY